MVRLFDIIRTETHISAKYTVVGYDGQGYVEVSLSDADWTSWVPAYDGNGSKWYAGFAARKLRQMMNDKSLPEAVSIALY